MFNASRWIEACIKGLLVQTHPDLEIFCIDDASEDDSYERVVDRFGDDGRLCIVKLARNVGPFQISNWVGGRLARGRRIAWQDADNVSHPTRIEAQMRWMSRERYEICGTCVHHFFPPDLEPHWPPREPVRIDDRLHELVSFIGVRRAHDTETETETDSTAAWQRAWRRNEIDAERAAERGLDLRAFERRLRGEHSMHGSQMVDTALFRELGGFEGRTKLGEDTLFDWRVSRFHDFGNLPHVLSSKRSHADSLMSRADTGLRSAARLRYREQKARRQERIDAELARGNVDRARELCLETLHSAEIVIDRVHTRLDVALP